MKDDAQKPRKRYQITATPGAELYGFIREAAGATSLSSFALVAMVNHAEKVLGRNAPRVPNRGKLVIDAASLSSEQMDAINKILQVSQ
jgi:uncharacterized protein (DUF1778 family)